MKHRKIYIIIAILGVILTNACKKKENINELPLGDKIILTRIGSGGASWLLNIDALAQNQADVWVDLNNNGIKDNGENVTKFGDSSDDQNIFPVTSRSIAIYGKITLLDCSSNDLTLVDVTRSPSLIELSCSGNRLTTLNTSKNAALEFLDCGLNELTSLDLSQNTAMKELAVYWNQLTVLDVSNNTALKTIDGLKNKIATLDLSKNIALETLLMYNNKLTTLDLSANPAIKLVNISNNLITNINMQQMISSLPMRSDVNPGELFLYYPPEGNTFPNTSDKTTASTKKWVLYEWKSGSWKPIS